jgi:hypothetical protein
MASRDLWERFELCGGITIRYWIEIILFSLKYMTRDNQKSKIDLIIFFAGDSFYDIFLIPYKENRPDRLFQENIKSKSTYNL